MTNGVTGQQRVRGSSDGDRRSAVVKVGVREGEAEHPHKINKINIKINNHSQF